MYALVTQEKFIAEDANGAEFITKLSEIMHWDKYVREVKNKTDMKKADGVVYDAHDNPIAIIELKSSDKNIANRDIIAQAFGYKNEKPTCHFVIISNFKQLDIYSESSDVCFSLDLTQRQSYWALYALLNQTSLETGEIARLKHNSKSQEQITKEVYKKYSAFRLNLLNNLIQNNPDIPKEELFSSANKLLDRFMFILFAEDRGLIPARSIDAIIKQYEASHEWGDDTPLYEYYKKYFHFIDSGNDNLKIPRYNGNLFKPDDALETLTIDDEVIKDDLSNLSAYDFSEDVDVEVLGHIFEQSLNDLEKIKESLFEEHKVVDTRKKDGVFYTKSFTDVNIKPTDLEQLLIPKIPKSIEKYIQNTNYLLTMPKKAKYDKITKYAVGEIDGQEIYMTEFLMAKELGYIEKFQGHGELKEYLRLLPFLFSSMLFERLYYDTKSQRDVYMLDDFDGRKIAHVVDEENYLLSVYLLRKNEHKRFLKKATMRKEYLSGEAPVSPILSPARAAFWRHLDTHHSSKREGGHFSILSPARPFWRHLDLLEQLYHDLAKNTITQEPFIALVDEIMAAKEKITKYKKHFESLSAVDKIEITEEIEKLGDVIKNNTDAIDRLVYKFYGLSNDEIATVEGENRL